MKIKTDAGNRAKRTFWQGMGVSVVLGVAGVTAQLVGAWTHSDVLDGAAWVVLGTSVIQAGLTAAASYAQRHIETLHKVKPYEVENPSEWETPLNGDYSGMDPEYDSVYDSVSFRMKRGKHE